MLEKPRLRIVATPVVVFSYDIWLAVPARLLVENKGSNSEMIRSIAATLDMVEG